MNECTVHSILEYMLTIKKISDLGWITNWRKVIITRCLDTTLIWLSMCNSH